MRISKIIHEFIHQNSKKMYILTGLIQSKLHCLHWTCTSLQRYTIPQYFLRIPSFWDTTQCHWLICSIISTYWRHLEGSKYPLLDIPTLQNEAITLPRNVGNKLASDTASYPRRTGSTATSLRNPYTGIFLEFKMNSSKCRPAFDWTVAIVGY
jgi:hypothetical protein